MSSLRIGRNGMHNRFSRKPSRVWITCVVCGRGALAQASAVRPPRSRVSLCGGQDCHVAWKMAIVQAFDLSVVA